MNGGKAMKGVYEGYFESEQAISDSYFRMRVLRAILIVILLFPHMSEPLGSCFIECVPAHLHDKP